MSHNSCPQGQLKQIGLSLHHQDQCCGPIRDAGGLCRKATARPKLGFDLKDLFGGRPNSAAHQCWQSWFQPCPLGTGNGQTRIKTIAHYSLRDRVIWPTTLKAPQSSCHTLNLPICQGFAVWLLPLAPSRTGLSFHSTHPLLPTGIARRRWFLRPWLRFVGSPYPDVTARY